MLIDIRIPPQEIDLKRMTWLVENNLYFIRVFTKCDSLNKNKINQAIDNYNSCMLNKNWGQIPETIVTSSIKKVGRENLLKKIEELNKLFQNL